MKGSDFSFFNANCNINLLTFDVKLDGNDKLNTRRLSRLRVDIINTY